MGRPKHFRSLASTYSVFTGKVLMSVILATLSLDFLQHTLTWKKGMVLCGLVGASAVWISRFTMRVMARPLKLLQAGITSVGEGQLRPIQVSRTGDEVEYRSEERRVGKECRSRW